MRVVQSATTLHPYGVLIIVSSEMFTDCVIPRLLYSDYG